MNKVSKVSKHPFTYDYVPVTGLQLASKIFTILPAVTGSQYLRTITMRPLLSRW